MRKVVEYIFKFLGDSLVIAGSLLAFDYFLEVSVMSGLILFLSVVLVTLGLVFRLLYNRLWLVLPMLLVLAWLCFPVNSAPKFLPAYSVTIVESPEPVGFIMCTADVEWRGYGVLLPSVYYSRGGCQWRWGVNLVNASANVVLVVAFLGTVYFFRRKSVRGRGSKEISC